jgi:hypothetical protein
LELNVDGLTVDEVIRRIITLNKNMTQFWSKAHGWAGQEAADLLSRSRLDWQVSISYRLRDLFQPHSPEEDQAKLIESWARLGTLVENTLKLVFSVYLTDYKKSEVHRFENEKVKDPDGLKFGVLKSIFLDRIGEPEHKVWLDKIQDLRNSIHAYKDKELYSWDHYQIELRRYLEFLRYVNSRLPYPDDIYSPRESEFQPEYL